MVLWQCLRLFCEHYITLQVTHRSNLLSTWCYCFRTTIIQTFKLHGAIVVSYILNNNDCFNLKPCIISIINDVKCSFFSKVYNAKLIYTPYIAKHAVGIKGPPIRGLKVYDFVRYRMNYNCLNGRDPLMMVCSYTIHAM